MEATEYIVAGAALIVVAELTRFGLPSLCTSGHWVSEKAALIPVLKDSSSPNTWAINSYGLLRLAAIDLEGFSRHAFGPGCAAAGRDRRCSPAAFVGDRRHSRFDKGCCIRAVHR